MGSGLWRGPKLTASGAALVCEPRHAGEGPHPRLPLSGSCKAWMPTFVGMTAGGQPATPNDAVNLGCRVWEA